MNLNFRSNTLVLARLLNAYGVTFMLGVLFALIWSLSFIATKIALVEVTPVWLAACRLLIAGFTLFIFQPALIYHFWIEQSAKRRLHILLAGMLSQGVYLSASYWALVYMPTAVVNIVVSALPLVTIPFSFALLGEKIKLSSILAFCMSIAGVWIALTGQLDLSAPGLFTRVLPSGLLLLSVAALALGNVWIKPLITSRALAPICTVHFISAGVAAAIVAVFIEPAPKLSSLVHIAPYLLFLAGAGSILGTLIWFKVLRVLSTNGASSFFLLTPVFGILGGSVFLSEPVTENKIVGAAVILSAVILRVLTALRKNRDM